MSMARCWRWDLASAIVLAGPLVAALGLIGGIAGGSAGNYVGGKLFGEGSDGQKLMAFGGGLLGGYAGGKGGAWFERNYNVESVGLGSNLGGMRITPKTPKSLVDPAHVAEMKANGVKFSESELVATGRDADGKVAFLERGNEKAGLEHIVKGHGADFEGRGIAEDQIPHAVMTSVTDGKQVGFQGKGTGRPIYETEIDGRTQHIAVTKGSNGFIVGANPAKAPK